jgi:hypothetical protein
MTSRHAQSKAYIATSSEIQKAVEELNSVANLNVYTYCNDRVNVLSVCLADQGRLVTGVMLACWLMEVVRAMFTKSRDKTIEQLITGS